MKRTLLFFTSLLTTICSFAQQQVVEIEMTNLNVENYFFMFTAQASNDDYFLSLTINSWNIVGEYTNADFSDYSEFKNIKEDKTITLVDRKASVSSVNDQYVIEAELLSSDDILYKVKMRYEKSDIINEIAVNFDETSKARYAAITDSWTLKTENSDYAFQMVLNSEVFNGEFATASFDTKNTFITDKNTGISYSPNDISARITPDGDTSAATIVFDSENGTRYNISLSADTSPNAKRGTRTIEVIGGDFVNSTAQNGGFILRGNSTDSKYYVSVSLCGNAVAGEYSAHDIVANQTVIEGYNDGEVELEDGNITVTDANGLITLHGIFACSDDYEYDVTMKYSDSFLRGDATEGNAEATYNLKELNIVDDIADEGKVIITAKAADESSICNLLWNISAAGSDFIIPVGTYPIDHSGNAGTLAASTGIKTGTLTPSYYCHYNYDGMMEGFFFFNTGEAVVTDKAITITGANSIGLPINITIDIFDECAGINNIQNINTDCRKIITNGRIIIIRNENKYNITGIKYE